MSAAVAGIVTRTVLAISKNAHREHNNILCMRGYQMTRSAMRRSKEARNGSERSALRLKSFRVRCVSFTMCHITRVVKHSAVAAMTNMGAQIVPTIYSSLSSSSVRATQQESESVSQPQAPLIANIGLTLAYNAVEASTHSQEARLSENQSLIQQSSMARISACQPGEPPQVASSQQWPKRENMSLC